MRDAAFVAAWLVLLPLSFRGAYSAMLLWTWTSLLAPADLLYGLGTAVPFSKLAAVPTLLQLLFWRGTDTRFHLGRAGWLLLLLAGCAVASQAASPMADADAGWDLCQKLLKILALALVVLWVAHDRLRVHGLLMAICLGIGFIAVDEGAKFILSGSGHKVLGSASIGDNNQVALDVLLIVPILQYLHATAATRRLRWVCIGGGLLAVVTVVATYSRGGFAGLVVVALGSVAASRHKIAASLLLIAAIGVGAQSVGADWIARMHSLQTADDDSSFMGRVGAWKVSTALALDRPFLGGGLHAIQHVDVWRNQAGGVRDLDFIPTPPQEPMPRAAHSIYFEVLGDLGFPGLVCFLLLFAGAWRDAAAIRRMVRKAGRADLRWAADLAAKLRISLLVFLASGGLLSAAYYDIDYLLVALLAALRIIVTRGLAAPTPQAA